MKPGLSTAPGIRAAALWFLGATALVVACASGAIVAGDYDAETSDLIASLDRHRALHATLVAVLDRATVAESVLSSDDGHAGVLVASAHEGLGRALAGGARESDIARVQEALGAHERWAARVVALDAAGRREEARDAVRSGEGARLLADVRMQLEALERAEDARVDRLVRSVAIRRGRVVLMLVGGIVVALAIAIAGLVFAWRQLHATAARARSAEESERRFRQIADSSADLVRIHERDGRAAYVSPSARRLLGRAPEDVAALSDAELVPDEDRAALAAAVASVVRGGAPDPVTHRFLHADGSSTWFETLLLPIHDESGALVRWQAASRDVHERKLAEEAREVRHSRLAIEAEELREASNTDPLTGLLNRRGLLERAASLFTSERAAGRSTAIIFADLDGLKEVNDRLGHAAGDRLLKASADVLRSVVRDDDLCARVGGDEFVVFVSRVDADGALAFRRRLDDAMRTRGATEPFDMSMSLGHAVATATPPTPETLDELIEQADARMYEAKRQKKRSARGPASAAR